MSTDQLKREGYGVMLDDDFGDFMWKKDTGERIDFFTEGNSPKVKLWIMTGDNVDSIEEDEGSEDSDDEDCNVLEGFIGLGK